MGEHETMKRKKKKTQETEVAPVKPQTLKAPKPTELTMEQWRTALEDLQTVGKFKIKEVLYLGPCPGTPAQFVALVEV